MDKERYIEPIRFSTNVYADERGRFLPFIISKDFQDFKLVQFNTVTTDKPYTFRGLHWQEPPYAQAKIIRCPFGKIIDFAVDIRSGSPNYGKSYGFVLSSYEDWVYIPEGFAHGYVTLPHNLGQTYPTIVEYLVNNEYNKESERGMFITQAIHDVLANELPIGMDLNMNDRDLRWPTINEIKTEFKYEPDEQ